VVCIGVAVLKYHLYEIDRIVSRVVSYAIITALLAGVFSGLIVLATEVLPVRTPVAVAVSTLAVAALFNPLRRRVQRAVDHRFNRARYNTAAVVAAFTARLRQTVDFDTVQGDLVGVVTEAFQPSYVALWLTTAAAQREDRPNSARTSVS
jgi:ABC-type bacteriocin/lantibiotic exporter with double-glycine peptidase domain